MDRAPPQTLYPALFNTSVGPLVLGFGVGLWRTSWAEFALSLNRTVPSGSFKLWTSGEDQQGGGDSDINKTHMAECPAAQILCIQWPLEALK